MLLHRAVETGRVHSAYLISGDPAAACAAAEAFSRALVCNAPTPQACGTCRECLRSAGARSGDGEAPAPIEIDPTGKRGPLLRHIGDHPDLLWVDRGIEGTRVRIAQVRALQHALRLSSNEGARRVGVIADAQWLNVEAQSALLRLLEEPPDGATLVLVAASAAGLLATIRSRCQRVRLPLTAPPALRDPDAAPELRAVVERLDRIGELSVPELLDWAEQYRGERSRAAESVQELLATASEWLRLRTCDGARAGRHDLGAGLDAFRSLNACRKDLAQRNANPQMVAERALFALHGAAR